MTNYIKHALIAKNNTAWKNIKVGVAQNEVLDLSKQDFSGCNIQDKDLSGVNFKNSNFSKAQINNVNFSASELIGCDFSGATLFRPIFSDKTKFSKENFKDITMIEPRFDKTGTKILNRYRFNDFDFSGSKLKAVVFKKFELANCDFTNAELEEVEFYDCDLSYLDLSTTTIDDKSMFSGDNKINAIVFPEAYYTNLLLDDSSLWNFWREEHNYKEILFIKVSFYNQNIKNKRFRGCKFINVSFEDATLEDVDFDGAILDHVNFQQTKIISSYFLDVEIIRRCRFPEAIFDRVSLGPNVNLSYTDFAYAKFKDSSITNIDFSHSNFQNAHFDDTNCFDVNYKVSNFSGTIFSKCEIDGCNFKDSVASHNTKFHNLESIKNSIISRNTINQLDDNRGGLQLSHLQEMDVEDDLADLKFEFSGFWRIIHAVALSLFLFPYVFFLFKCWSISEGMRLFTVPVGWSVEDRIWSKLGEYFWTGGNLNGEFSWIFMISLVLFLYNVLRALLMFKEVSLEHKEVVSGLPVKFSFEDVFYRKVKWKHLFFAMKYGMYFNITLAIFHFAVFINKPILPII